MKRVMMVLVAVMLSGVVMAQKEYRKLVRFNVPVGTTEANAKNIIRSNNYSISGTNDNDGVHYISYRDEDRGIVTNYYITIGVKDGKVESVKWLLKSDSYDRITSEYSALFAYLQEELNYKSVESEKKDYYTNFNYYGQKVGAVLYGQASYLDGGFVGITFYSNMTIIKQVKEIEKKKKYDALISAAWNLRYEKKFAEAKEKYDQAFVLFPEKSSSYETEYAQCLSEIEKAEQAERQRREQEAQAERQRQEREAQAERLRREREVQAELQRREMEESAKRQRQEEEARQQARVEQLKQQSREIEQAYATFYTEFERKISEGQIIPDSDPAFPGGTEKLNAYLADNIQYPSVAADAGISGVVVVSFIIEKDGTISEVKCLRNIGGGCGDEAVRIVKTMPKWIPGVKDGKLVRCQFKLPITFAFK